MKIVIFGTGSTEERVRKILNEKVEIVAYLDNNRNKWGTIYNNIKVCEANKIKELQYDYVVIASQYNKAIYDQLLSIGVESKKIMQYYIFADMYNDFFNKTIDNFNRCNNVEVLATGISYAYSGLNVKLLKKAAFNFSYPSQDIYFAYNIIKKLLKEKRNNLKYFKYCLIGLCYYDFQYDLSKSSIKSKVILYYDFLKKEHNYGNIAELYEMYKLNNNIAEEIFNKTEGGKFDFKWNLEVKSLDENNDLELMGKVQASIDCRKDNPETVEENKMILKEYFELLTVNNIKPVVIVYPASKYYTNNFSEKIENQFNKIIREFKEEYNFQYIDYFRSKLFNDKDFRDVSHLNAKGRDKFTKILNEIIEW